MIDCVLPYGLNRRRQPRRAQQRPSKKFLLSFVPHNPLISIVSDEEIQGNPIAVFVWFRRVKARFQENPNKQPRPWRSGAREPAPRDSDERPQNLRSTPLRCATAYFARIASNNRATMLVILIAGLTAGPAVSL
jgi:hypothetical protein